MGFEALVQLEDEGMVDPAEDVALVEEDAFFAALYDLPLF